MLKIEKKPFLPHWRFSYIFQFVDKSCWGFFKNSQIIKPQIRKLYLRKTQGGFRGAKYCQFKSQHHLPQNFSTFFIPYRVYMLGYSFDSMRQREYAVFKDWFGRFYYRPAFDFFYPGVAFKGYFDFYYQACESYYMVNALPITFIPINTSLSYIYNTINNYPQYALGVGCVAWRRKRLRQARLIYVSLPSTKRKLFEKTRLCFFSTISHYRLDEQFFGAWRLKTQLFKKLQVRGVAKNPVDHPNGGRTKAKQPEKSPWAWVAKKQR